MPETQNARFEVLINGKRRCVAGVEGLGVMGVILDWVKRAADRKPTDAPLDEWTGPRVNIDCGAGLSDDQVHVHWLSEPLCEGDEVTIRVLGPGFYDSPAARSPPPPVSDVS